MKGKKVIINLPNLSKNVGNSCPEGLYMKRMQTRVDFRNIAMCSKVVKEASKRKTKEAAMRATPPVARLILRV